MHTVYGAPLPPSVEASTKGELRIRVDRLVLDDAAINRNPLVQLGGGGNVAAALSPPAAATTTTAPPSRPVHGEDGADDVMDGDGVGGAAASTSSTTTRHHRLVVPINYCAVSPLFWGEARASAHCQPATPQQSRGPVTLVYPVKVRERVFAEYLHNMTRSAQHGLQLDVYVPSSYSGRRAEPVGRSIVRLDDLVTYKQLSGWFTVAHYRTAPLPAHDESALPPPQQAPRVADAASASPPPFVIIGKMKLHMQLVYFASPARRAVRPVPSKTAADATTTATLTAASTHRRGSSDGGVLATPTQQQQRPPHVTHDANALHTPPPPPPRASSSSSSTPNPLTRATPTPTTAAAATQPQSPVPHGKTADTVAAAPPAVVVAAATTTTADGHAAATPHNDDNATTTTSAAPPPPTPPVCTCSNDASNNNDAGTSASTTTTTSMALHALMRTSARLRDEMAAEEARVHRAVLRPYTTNKDEDDDDDARDVSDSDDDDDDEGDASLYTSECSDREARLLAMHDVAAPQRQQQNKQQRQQVRQVRRPPASPQQQQQPLLPLPPTLSEAAPARRGVACVSADDHTATRIELSLGNFAFAHNATTSRVRAMRINVRLSSDMTTDSPTAGPYSSYVHRVPLTQRAICLCFPVRRYSAHDSRLVIELYAVLSRADDARTATATTSAQRQRRTHADDDGSSNDASVREVTAAAAEELLGLCIVGVYAQSREVVLRDCVHDVNHATAHLELQLRPCVQPSEANAQQQQQQQQQQRQQQRQRGARRDDTQHARRHRRHRHRRHRTSPHDSDDAHGVRSFHSNDDVDDESDGGSSNRTHVAHASPAHPRRATASHTPPSPRTTQQQQQQQQDGDSARTARRLCVRIAIVSAKELPRVTVYRSLDEVDDTRHHRRRSGHRNSSDDNKGTRADTTASSLSSLRTRVVPLSAAEERCYVAPSSFVVVEDIYSGLDRHHASTAPVSEWHVQHYEHGHYDRTHVVADATCPVYNYLCVASLPRESVYLQQQQQQHEQSAGADTTTRPCLRELLLTMWHKTDAVTEDAMMATAATADGGNNDDNSSNGNNEAHNAVAARRRGRTQQQQQEQHKLLQQSDADFWAHTAYMGEVRVDLRPLRYLAQLDGYYRVVATDTAPPGCRAALTAVPGQTIGYVRVCVTLQSPSS